MKTEGIALPWEATSPITGSLAIGNLRETLLSTLKNERGIHVESLMLCLGALHGRSAQHAALSRAEAELQEHSEIPDGALVEVQTETGGKFIFGDWINEFLFPSHTATISLSSIVFGQLIQLGCTEDDLPVLEEMATHYAKTVGTPEFHLVRVAEENTPHLLPKEAIEELWPLFVEVMNQPGPESVRGLEPRLRTEHWPILAAVVGAQFIELTKEVCHPLISAHILIESSIIGSKLDFSADENNPPTDHHTTR